MGFGASSRARIAIVVDDLEGVRESHARTLRDAGYDALALSFEAAMVLPDAQLAGVDLAIIDLHDARSTAERRREAEASGVTARLPLYDRIAGWRLLKRLDQLGDNGPVPAVVVASAVMQLEPDLTDQIYEFAVVSGAFSTLGVATEAEWLSKVQRATSVVPSRTVQDRWADTVARTDSPTFYRNLRKVVDKYPRVVGMVLREGGARESRQQKRELQRLNAELGAFKLRRDSLRGLLRKSFGWGLPHRVDESDGAPERRVDDTRT